MHPWWEGVSAYKSQKFIPAYEWIMGEDIKCPRCGRLIPSGNKCQMCDLPYDETNIYRRRKRKRRGIIAVAILCAITFLLLASSMTDWFWTPSQKHLVTSADLGDGWKISGPYRRSSNMQGVTDSAFINIDSLNMRGDCWLYAHSTTEMANASYQIIIRDLSTTWSPLYETVDIHGADRAVIFTILSDIAPEGQRIIIFEKGTWVTEVSLFTKDLSGLDPSKLIRVAEVQAAKLP